MKKILITICVAITLLGCENINHTIIRPSGKIISEERIVTPFSKIMVSEGINLIVYNDDYQSVIVETQENLHEFIQIIVTNECLNIFPKPGISFGVRAHLNVYVTAEWINSIEAGEGVKVEIPNGIYAEHLELKGKEGTKFKGYVEGIYTTLQLSEGSKAELGINSTNLEVSGYEGSTFDLNGRASTMNLKLNEGSRLDAYDLEVDNLNIHLYEGSHAKITVNSLITGTLKEGSKLNYRGTARISVETSSGSSIN